MESNDRFFRRRANEEMKAASRAITDAARDRRMRLAGIFLERLKTSQQGDLGDTVGDDARHSSGAADSRSSRPERHRGEPTAPSRPFITL